MVTLEYRYRHIYRKFATLNKSSLRYASITPTRHPLLAVLINDDYIALKGILSSFLTLAIEKSLVSFQRFPD